MVDAIDRKIRLWQATEFAIVHEVRQVKDLETRCVAFWLYTPRRGPCESLNSDANRRTGRVAATPGRFAPCWIIGVANVSPALFSLLGKLIITRSEEHTSELQS